MEAYLSRFLADPETILAASIDLQLAIANYIYTPAQLLEILINSPDLDVASAAQLHVTWAGEIEGDAERSIDDLLKTQQIGQNDRLAVELLKLGTVPPCFVSQWVPPNKIVERLDNPQMPVEYKIEFLERLAREDRLDIVVPVAGSIDTPPQLLARSIGSVHLAIRDTARNNPSCPPETIELIDREYEIAANWDTPPAQLSISATSPWEWIRLTVAQNPFASAETLLVLAQAEVARIRLAVANNPHAPAAVLQVLAENNEGEIRSLVAKHPHASEETLHQLFTDCQNVLQGRTDLPLSFLERFFEQRDRSKPLWEDYITRDFLLRNSKTSVALLAELATDYLEEIRANRAALNYRNSEVLETWVLNATDYLARIVQHPNISVETLTDLASHYNPKVRLAVGLNQKTPETIKFNLLEQLGCHPIQLDCQDLVVYDSEIKTAIARDINTPLSILSKMAENEFRENKIRAKICSINELDGIPFWTSVVAALLENPQTPEILREQLWVQYQKPPEIYSNSYHRDTNLRLALAINPSVSIERRKDYLRQIVNSYQKMSDSIARNPTIPQDLLLELAEINAGIRQAITQNPNAPYSLILELSKNSNSTTRNYVAKNPSTPLDILLTLTNDGALNNPNFPPLERYRVTLENNLAEEQKEASALISRLPRRSPQASPTKEIDGIDRDARITIARNLKISLPVIKKLSQDPDEDVRCAIAENKNLPLSILLAFTNDESNKVRAKSIEVLLQLVQDSDNMVNRELAKNPNTPPEVLGRLAFADDPGGWIAKGLVNNQNTSIDTLEYLGIKKHVVNAYNKNTPSKALAAQVDYALTLSYQGKNDILEFLLRDIDGSQMPASSLDKLADRNEGVSKVAQHRNTSSSTLEKLSNSKDRLALCGIARNPNSSLALLEKILREHDPTVVSAMTERAIIPPNIMGRLLENESEHLRSRIVYRNNLPLDLADRVINTETHDSVLISLARNPILTSELISTFIQRHELKSDICIALLFQPNLTIEHWQQLASSQFEVVRLAIASRDNTPIDISTILADDRELKVRMAIASNSQTPNDILVKLATDLEAEVRNKIATNSQTPVSILEALAVDPSVEVRRSVLNNPQTPASIRQDLEDIFGRKPIPMMIDTLRDLPRIYDPVNNDVVTILTEYARSNNAFVRLVSLLHPLMPLDVIERAARSACWSDRYAVAKNPAAPDLVRQNLKLDSNRIVRSIASMKT
jgi:hypothetical protein